MNEILNQEDNEKVMLNIHGKEVSFHPRFVLALPIGCLFDEGYTILKMIGVDELGASYLVEDKQSSENVVLQLFRSDIVEENFIAEIHREVSFAQRLEHSGFVSLIRFVSKGDCHYLIRSALDGKPLIDLLDQTSGRLKLSQGVAVITSILEAICSLHSVGVTHLNIHLGNIYVLSDGDCVILDYGFLAKVVNLNREGVRFYQPPEQSSSSLVGLSADVFSVGMLFYRIMTGKFPFESKHHDDIVRWHQRSDDAAVFDEIPMSIRNVVAKALQTDPLLRFQAAKEMLLALRHASVQNGWYRVHADQLDVVKSRGVTDQIVCNDQFHSIHSMKKLSKIGGIRPTVKTLSGKLLLASSPIPLYLAEEWMPAYKDNLLSQLMPSLDDGTIDFTVLKAASLSEKIRLIKLAVVVEQKDWAVSQMGDLLATASEFTHWFLLAEVYFSSFSDKHEATLMLDRAINSATTSLHHLEIAGGMYWWFFDERRTKISLQSAEKSAISTSDWLAIAQAWLALLQDEHQSKLAIGQAMNTISEDSFVRQTQAAAEAGFKLGGSPAVIRWGVSLELKAKKSGDFLAVYNMWNKMGLTDRATPNAHKRQQILLQELTRLRSRLVPLGIPLDLPVEPYDEYMVETYAKQISEQERLATLATELKNQAKKLGLPVPKLSKPFISREIDSWGTDVAEQGRLTKILDNLVYRAQSMGWQLTVPKAPFNTESINQLEIQLAEQESLAGELALVIAQAAEVDFTIQPPNFPLTKSAVQTCVELLSQYRLRLHFTALIERAELLQWSVGFPSGKLSSELLSQFELQVKEQESFKAQIDKIRSQAKELDWSFEIANPPWDAKTISQYFSLLSEQSKLVEKCRPYSEIVSTLLLMIEPPKVPFTEQQLTDFVSEVTEQQTFHNKILSMNELCLKEVSWHPESLNPPYTQKNIESHTELINSQINLYHSLVAETKMYPESLRNRFSFPLPPFSEEKNVAYIVELKNYIRKRKQVYIIVILLLISVLGGVVFFAF